MSEKALRFGPVRFRGVVLSLAWALLLGFAIITSAGLPLAGMLLPLVIAGFAAVRSWRLGIYRSGDELIVRHFTSKRIVRTDSVEAAYFGEPLLPKWPSSLRLRLKGGQVIKVGGVSATKNLIPIDSKQMKGAESRIAEFFCL